LSPFGYIHGYPAVAQNVFSGNFPVLDAGAGRRKTYPDRTILKIDMLMHLTGKRGETEILREIKRHYQTYFDQLPGQSHLWHRIRS
jgi:hypothetical protein